MDDCAFIEFDKFDKSIQGLIPVSKLANATSSAYLFTMLNDNLYIIGAVCLSVCHEK